jgi:hypothetical protein
MTTLIPKAVIIAYPRASPDPLYTIFLTNAYCNTLINSAMVTYFNCGKDNYFTLSCLELKDIGNIKEIKEEEISNKLKKEEP